MLDIDKYTKYVERAADKLYNSGQYNCDKSDIAQDIWVMLLERDGKKPGKDKQLKQMDKYKQDLLYGLHSQYGVYTVDMEDRVYREYVTDLVQSSRLNETEKAVIHYRYYEELTFKDIAKTLGKSNGRISQIEAIAICKLKKYGFRVLLKE